MYLCFSYNPAACSPYIKSLNIDYLDVLEKDIANISRVGKIVIDVDCILGDQPFHG